MTEPVSSLELGEEQVVRIRGSIDFTNNEEFSAALSRAIEKGPRVVIDLSQAEALDSSAIAILSSAYHRARDLGVRISLPAASESVMRILQMSGLASTLGISLVRLGNDDTPSCSSQDLRRQDWRITESVILAEPELIAPLRELALAAALEAGLSAEAVTDVRVAATEALANALQHGSPKPGESKITLRCLSCPRALVIEVADEGEGFNPDQARNTDASPEQGGLGLKLMQAAMDEVEFIRDPRGGRVRMLKWIRDDSIAE